MLFDSGTLFFQLGLLNIEIVFEIMQEIINIKQCLLPTNTFSNYRLIQLLPFLYQGKFSG